MSPLPQISKFGQSGTLGQRLLREYRQEDNHFHPLRSWRSTDTLKPTRLKVWWKVTHIWTDYLSDLFESSSHTGTALLPLKSFTNLANAAVGSGSFSIVNFSSISLETQQNHH
ncbi:hypothetical protein BLNAU_13004 [Blattamonas nauphoetae]|uniref:Uncharacterized protein n=1 Tax=Blattamonas nauphoetae TaxID=2049346 RepID=A0ABQ9XKW1_9EUKA|nr:hypothetical protein BLNAU_13004 [Blattamonas nauphoetae]